METPRKHKINLDRIEYNKKYSRHRTEAAETHSCYAPARLHGLDRGRRIIAHVAPTYKSPEIIPGIPFSPMDSDITDLIPGHPQFIILLQSKAVEKVDTHRGGGEGGHPPLLDQAG
jgi:hypothetical protein